MKAKLSGGADQYLMILRPLFSVEIGSKYYQGSKRIESKPVSARRDKFNAA